MKTKILLLTIICFSFFISLFSQKPEFKFGKIDNNELKATLCPIDSTAEAYFLGDFGTTSFEYVDTKDNFQSIFEEHLRIKILKKTAFHWADFVIPLYRSSNNGSDEKISDLKACTYNLEDGKVIVSKLDRSSTFKEEVNKNRLNFKFSMPNVKEGSIIEVSFKVYSDFWTVRDWGFQQTIPTLISQYEVRIPEYFNYKVFENGSESIKSLKDGQRSTFSYSWYEEEANGMRIPNSRHVVTIDYTTNITTYTGENIKAFHDEPYMSSRKNYLSSIEYELQSTQFPHAMLKSYTTDWKSITRSLLDYDEFGGIIKKKGATDDIVKISTSGMNQPLDKARGIYEYIRDNFKWDKTNRLYASTGIRKTIENKAGNSADINLLLVAALRNAELKANPVALSTRNNGIILMSYPVLQKLNYVIACVEIEGKQYLLDATDKNATFDLLPERCINGQGRIISEDFPGDINLTSNQTYTQSIMGTLHLNENADLTGTWQEVHKGYSAHDLREEVGNAKSKEDFITEKQKQNAGLTIAKFEIENLDSLSKIPSLKLDLTLSGQVETTGNLMMIHPLLLEQLKKNPFTLEERNYPVDYSHGYAMTYVANIEMPQGYQIETLPKAINMALPEKSATFMFNTVGVGNKIQVIRKFNINKTMFLPDEYKNLKEFYNQMVAKEAEVIVLKKM